MFKYIFSLGLLLSFSIAAAAPHAQQASSPTSLPSVELPTELARVLSDYEAAWQARDARALARLFVEDGFVLPHGRPPIRGRAEVERFYTGQGGPLALRALAYAKDASVGYIIGTYAERKGEAEIGKFTLTLRKAGDRRWLIVSDMDNPSRVPQRRP